jgi:DNA polymerase III subunit delta'
MRLVGYDNLARTFQRLIKEETLSHSYIFFGEPKVGKFSFALSLASYIEMGVFDTPELNDGGSPVNILQELLVVKPEEGSIGIDQIRDVKHFLSQKPVYAGIRTVIIDDAYKLTPEAQNAALKIAEEPPIRSLLILVTPNLEALMPTVQSRFQKIYFPRLTDKEVVRLLTKSYSVDSERAQKIASVSFGRPGRAISLAIDEGARDVYRRVYSALRKKAAKKELVPGILDGEVDYESIFTELIAELANEPIKNYDTLRLITERLTAISQFSTNKRLQLETALWNI